MAINAESVAKVVLYYQGTPITGDEIDFPLPINGTSEKFEKTSSYFYLVGNVDQADVVFTDAQFVLMPVKGATGSVNLRGDFIFNNASQPAQQSIRLPVLRKLAEGTSTNGVKIHFASEYTVGHYSKGAFANTFTLMITPVI